MGSKVPYNRDKDDNAGSFDDGVAKGTRGVKEGKDEG